jgi:2'-5' RNA ligase
MKRLFFALWPDQKTRTKLAKIISSLDTLELKPVRVDNIHLTLVFLGLVEEGKIAGIKQKAAEISAKPSSIIFDQFLYWQKPKVLCLGSSQSAPEILHLAGNLKQMVADFRIETDKRAYVPHVTLAKKAQIRSYLDFEPIRWSAESFSLVESITEPEGLYYKVVQSWSLNQ